MNKTPNLNLPIYDTPDVDVFDLQDWNDANIALDGAYKQITDFKEEIPKVNASAEVLEARSGEETLGSKIRKIDASLEEINYKQKPLRYGELKIPTDFKPTLPCTFYRDNDGLIKHNMYFDRYKGGTKIYVESLGNDTSGDGSKLKPYRTLTKAIQVAISGGDTKYEIITSVPIFNREECTFNQTVSNKTISIISKGAMDSSININNRYQLSPSNLSGTWSNTTSEQPFTTTINDYFETTVYGENIIVGYWTNVYGGLMEYTVDGGQPITVSQYSETTKYQEKLIYSGLNIGNHVIRGTFKGSDVKSTAPARGYVYINSAPNLNTSINSIRTSYLDESKKLKYGDKTIISANSNYVWTKDGNGTYKTTRSGVNNIIDCYNVDIYKLPVPLKNVNTLLECQNNKGTWYSDGSSIWVHRITEDLPTIDNTIVNIGVTGIDPIIGLNGVVYFENIIFTAFFGGNGLRARNTTSTTPIGELCLNNCHSVGTKSLTILGNGFTTDNIKNVLMFNCKTAYSQLDGYNYHATTITESNKRDCLALEYNCTAYELGIEVAGAGSNNISSAHEGISIFRVGTVGFKNTGGQIIDVNGCYSVQYDCNVRTPVTNGIEGIGRAFSFSKDIGSENAKAIIINCGATDCTEALVVGSNTTVEISNFNYEGNIVNNGTISYI